MSVLFKNQVHCIPLAQCCGWQTMLSQIQTRTKQRNNTCVTPACLPLEFYISIELVSNLLKTLSQLLVVWVTELPCSKLWPGHNSIAVSIPLNTFIDETWQDTQKQWLMWMPPPIKWHTRWMVNTYSFNRIRPNSSNWSLLVPE